MKMKSLVVSILLLAVFAGQALCQTSGRDPIGYEKKAIGYKFTRNGEKLKIGDLKDLLGEEPKAADELSTANSRMMTGMVIGGIGGGLVGWPIGASLGGGEDVNWNLAYAGGGLIAIRLFFATSADGHFRNAVDIYNGEIELGRLPHGTPLKLCLRPDGLAFCASF